MIQDIGPDRLNNAFRNCAPKAGDAVFLLEIDREEKVFFTGRLYHRPSVFEPVFLIFVLQLLVFFLLVFKVAL